MLKTTYYVRDFANPMEYLNRNIKMSRFAKRRRYKDILRHQRYNNDQPYVANLGAGRFLIAETPIEIEMLSCWFGSRTW